MPERKIWEFNHAITCKILGLTFDGEKLVKISKKLNSPYLSESQMHAALLQICASPNFKSKYLDKVLKKRFDRYQKKLKNLNNKNICEIIEGGKRVDGIPLSALIWFAVRDEHEEIKEIEDRIFAAVHMREHQALRFYDSLSQSLPGGSPENVARELEEALDLNEKFWDRAEKLERKIEKLKSELELARKENLRLDAGLVKRIIAEEKARRELEELNSEKKILKKQIEKWDGGSIFAQIESRDKEIELLKKEFTKAEISNRKLKRQNQIYEVANRIGNCPLYQGKMIEEENIEKDKQRLPFSLEGKRVAFVGGLDSLLPHYRRMVENIGGIFYNHCGKSSSGKGEIEKLVDKVDIVFCPLDINSHFACRCAKRFCKSKNKPCYFLRRSGINGLKEALAEFARGDLLAGAGNIRSLN